MRWQVHFKFSRFFRIIFTHSSFELLIFAKARLTGSMSMTRRFISKRLGFKRSWLGMDQQQRLTGRRKLLTSRWKRDQLQLARFSSRVQRYYLKCVLECKSNRSFNARLKWERRDSSHDRPAIVTRFKRTMYVTTSNQNAGKIPGNAWATALNIKRRFIILD